MNRCPGLPPRVPREGRGLGPWTGSSGDPWDKLKDPARNRWLDGTAHTDTQAVLQHLPAWRGTHLSVAR